MKWIGFFLSLCLASASFAGGVTSVGGDDAYASDGAAWFLGNRPVQACVQVSADFGPSEAEARSVVLGAWAQWKQYVLSKGINADPTPARLQSGLSDPNLDGYNDPHDPLARQAGAKRLALEMNLLDRCDGHEDLRFVLGLESPLIARYKSHYSRPIAFAQRTSYDNKLGWGRGFIWVTPPAKTRGGAGVWRMPYRLQGVLLHEIGHVFGNSHLGGTIMDEELPKNASEGNYGNPSLSYARYFFTQIDQKLELFLCKICAFDFEGAPDSVSGYEFHSVTGRDAVGKIRSRVFATKKSFAGEIHLVLKDDVGEEHFIAEGYPELISLHFGDTPLFKKAMGIDSTELHSAGTSELIRLKNKAGRTVTVILNRNMGNEPIYLSLLTTDDGHTFNCFKPADWTDWEKEGQ